MSEKTNPILSYLEYIFLIIIAGAVTYWVTSGVSNFFSLYASNTLGAQLLQFGGVLFGLFLTAYAIILSLVPSLGRVLGTEAMKKTNFGFIMALPATLLLIIVSFCVIFVAGSLLHDLIFLQLWLLFLVIELAFVLTVSIWLLFRGVIDKTPRKENC
jgi:hypothetical protein